MRANLSTSKRRLGLLTRILFAFLFAHHDLKYFLLKQIYFRRKLKSEIQIKEDQIVYQIKELSCFLIECFHRFMTSFISILITNYKYFCSF